MSVLPQGFLPIIASHAWTAEEESGWADWFGQSSGFSNRSAVCILAGLLLLWIVSVMIAGCCASCTSGSFYEPITVSSITWKRKKDWRMYLNYLLLLPLHFLRSMETASGGDQTLFSSAEKEFLASQRKVFNDAVVNFLSVRRSMMFVTGIFCMLALAIQLAVVPKAFESRRIWIEKSQIEVDGEVVKFHDFVNLSGQNWTDTNPEAWFQYTTHLYTGMFAKIISQTALIDIIEACVDVTCQFASCIYLWWGLRKWSHFHWSHRGVLRGWAFSLVAPFLATLIPTRLFVEWSVLDPVVHTFASELATHLGSHTDDVARGINQACEQLLHSQEQGHMESAESMARKACRALTKTPNRHLKCCSFIKIVDFDFRPIHRSCDKITNYLDSPEGPWHRKALTQAVDLCRDTVMPNLENTIQLGFDNALEVAATVGPVAQRMKQSVSMGMGFANGLRGFNTIMPAALALAPAMLRGALKVKVTAPQSTIPGMFVVVLPLLYCPMTWGMYHIAFQLLGDLWMLLGLLIMAFAPMVYLALGTYYSITRPLTDKAITRVMVSMNRASAVLAIIGYVFICTFAWKRYKLTMLGEEGDENSVERDAYKYIVQQVAVLQPSFWIQLAGVAMAKYFFTTLAGVDWMMVEIGKQRHYEILMEISQKIRDLEDSGTAVRYPKGLRTAEQREENLEAAEQRVLRLDCVFYILYDEVPVHVVEETRGSVPGTGPAAFRKRRTVLAPAVSGLEVELEDLQESGKSNETPEKPEASSFGASPLPQTTDASQPIAPENERSEPSGFASTWNFFFGLRTPHAHHEAASQASPRQMAVQPVRPQQPWQPAGWHVQGGLGVPLQQPLQHVTEQRLPPPQWSVTPASSTSSWTSRASSPPGPMHLRPRHF